MIIDIADGLTIAAATAAAFYCWSLNRKLKALRNTDQGLGASIKTLAETVEKARLTLADAKTDARAEQERLAQLINDAREMELKLDRFEFADHAIANSLPAQQAFSARANTVQRPAMRTERKFHRVFSGQGGNA
ncbi:MAG: hypothetical protein MRY63_07925 [Neomegalonema sp.]|nr:hypothetical protein [Neomegalonema sp.]